MTQCPTNSLTDGMRGRNKPCDVTPEGMDDKRGYMGIDAGMVKQSRLPRRHIYTLFFRRAEDKVANLRDGK